MARREHGTNAGPISKEYVHYEAPKAERVDVEMSAFLEWFEAPSGIDPVLKAAQSHLSFVTIQPFDDGNGRIAPAIADIALARSERSPQRFYSMSAQIRQDTHFVGGDGSVLSQIFRRNFPNYSAGFSLNIPFRNRVHQADYVIDQLQLRQAELEQQRDINQVRVDVKAAVHWLEQAHARYQTVVDTRRLGEDT